MIGEILSLFSLISALCLVSIDYYYELEENRINNIINGYDSNLIK